MPGIGNQFADVGTFIDLRSIGMIPAAGGFGVLGIIGTAQRGPANQVVATTQPSDGYNIFRSGPVKDAIELAYGNGSETNFALRVMGVGAAKAWYMLTDGVGDTPREVMRVEVLGEGGYGNGVAMLVSPSGYVRVDRIALNGDGSDDFYSMDHCNIVQNISNKITVNGTKRHLVYSIDSLLEANDVFVDQAPGRFKFHASNLPVASDEIVAYLYYETKTIKVMLGTENPEIYRDVVDLIDLEAKMKRGNLVRGTIQIGETHLPANTATGYVFHGGSNGDEPTPDDWYQSMLRLGDTLRLYAGAPTAIAFCNIETDVGIGTRDLLPKITDFLGYMCDMEAPCIGFVGMTEEDSLDENILFDVAQDFQDRNLVIVGNPWDTQTPRINGAVGRAAKTCAVPRGESCAMADNAMQGMGPLLFEYNPTTTIALTRRGVDMLEKAAPGGVIPHKGITTSGVEQWTRVVDQVEINYIIVQVFALTKAFRFHRNVNLERTSLQNSIKSMLEDELLSKNIYDYVCVVTPHRADPNRVIIKMQFIPIGHMEFFSVEMGVGVYEDLTHFAGV